jgi:hypothetical protein
MTTPQPASAYGNIANATLAFEVAGATLTVEPETGNQVAATEVINYLATLRLNRSRWEKQVGVDESTFPCTGRLLSPATLDPRIVSGSKASAVINGRRGRFELQENLDAHLGGIPLLRQQINGTFRVTGGRGDG